MDKTDYIYNMVTNGNYYFLSRPRRFGKTLLVDTLKKLFEGRKELFEGLWIYERWNWEERNPVIRVDFSSGEIKSSEVLEELIFSLLREHADHFDVEVDGPTPGFFLRKLVLGLYKKFNSRVVILIDEYDKPILDNITNKPLAEEIRNALADFYGVIKGLDEYLKFVFLTGVSKFSKVNLFSKLNNLTDITINSDYSAICGYKEADLDTYFGELLAQANREDIKKWYNGYSWLGETVYNPYDILLFIYNHYMFRNYWFSTGTPTFLIKLMQEKRYFIPELEELKVTETVLDSFDVETMKVEALLWQTGYLTIKGTEQVGPRLYYVLSYPNLEVQMYLNDVIIDYLANIDVTKKSNLGEKLYNAFVKGDVEGIIETFKSLLAALPYTSYSNSPIEVYEGYYQNVLYSFMASIGVDIIAEDVTNRGRIDLTVKVPGKTYIMEIKMKDRGSPLEQIRKQRYWEKYLGEVNDIFVLGVVIDPEKRNIVESYWERVTEDL